jgi:exosortase/archaeosortase family protein
MDRLRDERRLRGVVTRTKRRGQPGTAAAKASGAPPAEVGVPTRFFIVFLGAAALLFTLYAFPYDEGTLPRRALQAYLSVYAHLAGGVLSMFDSSVAVSGTLISGRSSLRIIRGCDAFEAQALFLAALLAWHEGSWMERIAAIAFGLSAIAALNVLRLCCLYYVGLRIPEQFDVFHLEVWPLVLISTAAGLFFLWTRRAAAIVKKERAAS